MRLDSTTAAAESPSPPSASLPGGAAWLARAYSDLTPFTAGILFLIVLLYILGGNMNGLLIAIVRGSVVAWVGRVLQGVVAVGLVAVVMVAIIVPVMNLGPQRGWSRAAALFAALVLAALTAALVRVTYVVLVQTPSLEWVDLASAQYVYFAARYGYFAGLITAVAEFYRRERLSLQAMHQAELDRSALDREMAQARLQVLQAQIEPHFLFNTLANVQRLYETDGRRGNAMLDSLMRYLEVALPRMREDTSTLEREASLVRAYLDVHQIRMGRRLAFDIDVPQPLRALAVPPMMLLTLVENAIKHGLNPLPEGGTVTVRACQEGGTLSLTVADTGRGFGMGTSGGGTGLANTRARLAAMYGDAARLDLARNAQKGVVATLTLPVIR